MPVVYKPSRNDDQCAIEIPPTRKFPQEQCDFDRFPESYFVSNQIAARRIGRDAMCQNHLVG